MRAIAIDHPGGPEVLAMREFPDSDPGPGDVDVRVEATALNRADLLQRRGLYPAPPGVAADIPGLEFSGVVARCGSDVAGFSPGDRVMGLLAGGGYAERVVVGAGLCMPVPPGLSSSEAAAIPEAFLTAFDALSLRAGLAKTETLLVPAAASGVGTAAVQLGRVCGASVIALSRTEEKRRRLTDWGADATLNPDTEDWVEQVRRIVPAGVDVVLDLVGGRYLTAHVDLLADRGRLVSIGIPAGARGELDLAAVMRKRLRITGSTLRSRETNEKVELVAQFRREVLPLFSSGELRPCVDSVLPWDEAACAHRRMEANRNFGKIVLEVR